MKNYGISKDETNVRWIVVGGGDRGHRADEGGDFMSREPAIREATERARRAGGKYVGENPVLIGDEIYEASR